MSSDNLAIILKHSPYAGVQLVVHVVLADIANDANGDELWVKTETLAKLSRCNSGTARRHILAMIEDGEVELLEDRSASHRASRYRLCMENYIRSGRAEKTTGPDSVAQFARPGRAEKTTDANHTSISKTPSNSKSRSAPNGTEAGLFDPINPPALVAQCFSNLWNAWPSDKRYDRDKCLAKFTKAMKTSDPVLAVSKARALIAAKTESDEAKFIPDLSTWINQKRWEAEVKSNAEPAPSEFI